MFRDGRYSADTPKDAVVARKEGPGLGTDMPMRDDQRPSIRHGKDCSSGATTATQFITRTTVDVALMCARDGSYLRTF
jgi:hypothetical protein